jgi:hypothetical protein
MAPATSSDISLRMWSSLLGETIWDRPFSNIYEALGSEDSQPDRRVTISDVIGLPCEPRSICYSERLSVSSKSTVPSRR